MSLFTLLGCLLAMMESVCELVYEGVLRLYLLGYFLIFSAYCIDMCLHFIYAADLML